ncbi:MAG: hypothetical protein JST93_13800 [Acidobacteria bacterium]|nr:hypothetical protein [Acidobacteriota bacterium]
MIRNAGRVVLAVLAAEAIMIAATIAWVAFYSYVIDTGHPAAYYEAYAQRAGPYVALTLGLPAFYLVCRKISGRGVAKAMAVFVVYCALEIPMLAVSDLSQLPGWLLPANFATKLLGCYLGGKP